MAEVETQTQQQVPVAPVVVEQPLADTPSSKWAEFDKSTTVAEPTAPAPAASTPTPSAPTLTPPPPPPAIDPRIQQELEALRQSNQQTSQQLAQQQAAVQEREDRQTLVSYTQGIQKAIEEKYGLTPEQAQEIAQQQAQSTWQQYNLQKTSQSQVAESQAKVIVAARIAEEFKVPITSLLNYNNPGAMRQAAESMTAQGKKDAQIAELLAENAKLKKNAVPAQSFNNGVQDGSGAAVTPDNIDALYLKDPDKYAAQYRAFLNR